MTNKEQELMKKRKAKKAAYMRRMRQKKLIKLAVMLLVIVLLTAAILFLNAAIKDKNRTKLADIQIPDWITQDFLDVNPYSRPGTELKSAEGIVVHYTANPETTAQQNRNYFNSRANQTSKSKDYVSSHFIIGLEGEILQIIPLNEWAYASNERNADTISIEVCHPDETGEFTLVTYQSLVKLTSWLEVELGLKEKSVIRHFDVAGKKCPLYFVEHEDKWKAFKKDVKAYRKQDEKKKEQASQAKQQG